MLMDPRIVRIVSVAILLVLGCLYVYAFVLNKPADEDRSFDPDPDRASSDLTFGGVSIEGRENGERVWKISAANVDLRDGDGRVEMSEIGHGEIYRDGEPYLSFKACKGVFDTKTGQLSLSGGVDVFSGGRKLLRTDEVAWKPDDSRIVIPGQAEIITEQGVVSAASLRVDVASDKIYASGDLTIREGFGGRDVVVKSGEICFDPAENSFEAWGGTEIEFEIGNDD